MAFGNQGAQLGARGNMPMTEINIIPLVDVMLVLLVIFIITAPLLTHSVKIDLPQASSQPDPSRAEHIELAINGDGALYWNGEPIDHEQLLQRLQQAGQSSPVPDLRLHADKETRYEVIAELMSAASRNGVARIGFVTKPAAATRPSAE
jgi:biopolymer transport protein ExbD